MYYGFSGALGARPTRPSEAATATGDAVRDPYEKIDEQMQTRVNAISFWGRFCRQQTLDLYTFVQGRSGSVQTRNESDVVAEITRVFDAMLQGAEKQEIDSYAAGFILATLKQRPAQDAALVRQANAYLECFEKMNRNLTSYLKQIRAGIETTINEGGYLRTTVLQLEGVKTQTRTMTDNSISCSGLAYPAYQKELGESRVQWNLARNEALEAQAVSEAMSAAADSWTQVAEDAAARAGDAAASGDSAAAAAAAAEAESAAAAAAAAEAESAAAAEAASAATENLEQMETPTDSEGFPWFWVGLGVVAAVGAGTAVYLSARK